MVNAGTAMAYLDLDTSRFFEGVSSARAEMRTFADSSLSVDRRLGSLSNVMVSTGKTLTKNVTLPLSALGAVSVKSAITFESAFAGVKKTVDATADEYDILSQNIKKMATETASSSAEIAGVMEVAGQLGIAVGENGKTITKFTKIMVELGDSTNLAAEEAATALAQFMNIMGTATDDVDRMGSAIVDLGNNFATTERDIVDMSMRLASSGKIAGLTEQEILALSTAMSSVGINAEAGGTAMSQTLAAIESAVASGGDALTEFARIAGMSTSEFAAAWNQAPLQALQSFISGLGSLEEKGENATLVLDEMGLSGIRQSNMLKALALSSENLAEAVDVSNKAWDENIALSNEAEQRYGTTESRLKQLKEAFNNVAIEIGEILIPFLMQLVEFLQKLIDAWNKLPEPMQEFIVKTGLVVTALGPLLMAGGKFLKLGLEIKALGGVSAIFGAGNIVSGLSGAATSAGGLSTALGGLKGALTGVGTAVKGATPALAGFGSAALTTGAALATFDTIKNPVIRAIGAITGDVETSEKMIRKYGYAGDTVRMLGDTFEILKNKVAGLPAVMDGAEYSYKAFEKALDSASKGVIYTNEQLETMQEKWRLSGEDIESIRQAMIDAHPAIVEITDNFVELNGASMETLQQVARGLEAMENAGASVDAVLSGNVRMVGQLNGEATAFFRQIKEDTVTVVTSVGEVEKKLVDSSGKMNEVGRNLMKGITDGIEEEKPKTVSSATGIISSVKKDMEKSASALVSIGKDVVKGFNKGVTDEEDSTRKTMEDYASIVPDTLHTALEEHSPSKLSERSGANTVYGFNNGIEDTKGTTEKLMSNWLGGVVGVLGQNSIINSMRGMGIGMVDEILAGIQSRWGNVINFFSNSMSNMGRITSGYNSIMRISGSHADGLSYVPYNGYIAELHEGERVMTKEENERYSSDRYRNLNITYQSPKAIDEYESARLLQKTIRELDL